MVSPSFWRWVVLVGYIAPSGPWPVSTSRSKVEAAGRGGERGEAVVPALAVDLRPERVDPERERRVDRRRVLAELVVGAEAQPVLERGVALGAALAEDLVERRV